MEGIAYICRPEFALRIPGILATAGFDLLACQNKSLRPEPGRLTLPYGYEVYGQRGVVTLAVDLGGVLTHDFDDPEKANIQMFFGGSLSSLFGRPRPSTSFRLALQIEEVLLRHADGELIPDPPDAPLSSWPYAQYCK